MTPLYSDLNQRNPQESPLVTDLEEVRQSLFNLMNMDPGDRFFNPEVGMGLEEYLFDCEGDGEAELIRDRIVSNVQSGDPRMQLTAGGVVLEPLPNGYRITVRADVFGFEDQNFEVKGILEK